MSTALEQRVVDAAGSNSMIWTFDQFADHLSSLGITSLSDVSKLKEFVKERPKLFTVSSDYLWSKSEQAPVRKTSGKLEAPVEPPKNDSPTNNSQNWNPVVNLINQTAQNPENSERIRLPHVQAIMFKIDWIYSKLPSHIRSKWKSATYFGDDMKSSSPNMFVYDISCFNVIHLAEVIESNSVPDRVARIIVDALLSMNGAGNINKVFDRLSIQAQAQLKSTKGLKGFVQFYPSLFTTFDESLALLLNTPLFRTGRNNYVKPKSYMKYDEIERPQQKKNAVEYLLRNAHSDEENSKVYVLNNIDSAFMKIKWLLHKLPNGPGRAFINHEALKAFMAQFPDDFVLIGNHAQLKKKLDELPCEKSVALEILKAKRKYPDLTDEEIAKSLPPSCQKRVPSGKSLSKFCSLHSDFFHDWQETIPVTNEPRDVPKVPPSENWVDAVKNLLKTTMHHPGNSFRSFTYDGKPAILFKSKWLFEIMPQYSSKRWASLNAFVEELSSVQEIEFGINYKSLHMKNAVRNRLSPEKLARIIVDQLFASPIGTLEKLFEQLPPEAKSSLINPAGLKGFSWFYPSLFASIDDGIALRTSPFIRNVIRPPSRQTKRANYHDQKKINSLVNLMTSAHLEEENSSIFVIELNDKGLFHSDWIFDKQRALFSNKKDAMRILIEHPDIFVCLGNYVNLRKPLEDNPCEKSIALEIMRIQQRTPQASHGEIVQKLPSSCRARIRSVNELLKFQSIHSEFLGRTETRSESRLSGASSATSAKASEMSEIQDRMLALQSQVIELTKRLEEMGGNEASAKSTSGSTTSASSSRMAEFQQEFQEMAPIEDYDELSIFDIGK